MAFDVEVDGFAEGGRPLAVEGGWAVMAFKLKGMQSGVWSEGLKRATARLVADGRVTYTLEHNVVRLRCPSAIADQVANSFLDRVIEANGIADGLQADAERRAADYAREKGTTQGDLDARMRDFDPSRK